ncbi:hypothetical protein BV25DRAFT_1814479, partial [Artomyces pyxidatus]
LDDSPPALLLRDRVVRSRTGRCSPVPVLPLPDYLFVPIPAYRKMLTQLLLSNHLLAEVRLRWAERCRVSVPHEFRLCCAHAGTYSFAQFRTSQL